MAESRPNADRVTKVSIIPRGVAALGYTLQTPTEDRYLMRRAELLDRIDVLLGGRVAEEIVFGDVSTGAQNDLQRVTDLARHMVTQYGMSETLGLVTFEEPRHQPLPQRPPAPAGAASTARRPPRRSTTRSARSSVRRGNGCARPSPSAGAALDALAKLLLEKEVVDRKGLEALVASYPA